MNSIIRNIELFTPQPVPNHIYDRLNFAWVGGQDERKLDNFDLNTRRYIRGKSPAYLNIIPPQILSSWVRRILWQEKNWPINLTKFNCQKIDIWFSIKEFLETTKFMSNLVTYISFLVIAMKKYIHWRKYENGTFWVRPLFCIICRNKHHRNIQRTGPARATPDLRPIKPNWEPRGALCDTRYLMNSFFFLPKFISITN